MGKVKGKVKGKVVEKKEERKITEVESYALAIGLIEEADIPIADEADMEVVIVALLKALDEADESDERVTKEMIEWFNTEGEKRGLFAGDNGQKEEEKEKKPEPEKVEVKKEEKETKTKEKKRIEGEVNLREEVAREILSSIKNGKLVCEKREVVNRIISKFKVEDKKSTLSTYVSDCVAYARGFGLVKE